MKTWTYNPDDKTLTDPDGKIVTWNGLQPMRFHSDREVTWWLLKVRQEKGEWEVRVG